MREKTERIWVRASEKLYAELYEVKGAVYQRDKKSLTDAEFVRQVISRGLEQFRKELQMT